LLGEKPLEQIGADPADSEHRALLIKTGELIEHTRPELSRLREEIETARDTVDRSQRLLSRTEPSSDPREFLANIL
jgi:hypothetical protein